MASFLDKIKIKTALDERTKLDLSCNHISSADWMQLNVAWSKELVPKEKISVDIETFSRLAPMPVPTFGRGNINTRAFFVPFRTIFPGWNDFITDTNHVFENGSTGHISSVPYISNRTFVECFRNPELSTETANPSNVQTGTGYDFIYVEEGISYGLKLTNKGRQAMKILNSLGYKINWNNRDGSLFSALPLLALVKVYFDWYYPSQYANIGLMATIESLLNMNYSDNEINESQLFDILYFIPKVNYDSDYFVSAWDNPYNPNDGTFSNMSLTDPTNGTSGSTTRTVSVNVDGISDGSSNAPVAAVPGKLTQWTIDTLKSMTDYMKRHQLVGARALDRYLARFGVQLSSDKLKRSLYLGSNTQPLSFNDVFSTASTDDAMLGDYAGKGMSYGRKAFEFETDEYGIMLVVSSIVPIIGYYQGVDRNVRHLSKLDYWTPEFDNLGTQAIAADELYVPINAYQFTYPSQGRLDQTVFGFTPRYAEYKVSKDKLTGDLFYNSMNTAEKQAWNLFREVEYNSYVDIVHNLAFVQGNDSNQYNRIFHNVTDSADKFNIIYNCNVMSLSPMKSLFDTYEFDSHGKTVTEDANGVKMN